MSSGQAITILSDGGDNDSARYSYNTVLQIAKSKKIRINVVLYNYDNPALLRMTQETK